MSAGNRKIAIALESSIDIITQKAREIYSKNIIARDKY